MYRVLAGIISITLAGSALANGRPAYETPLTDAAWSAVESGVSCRLEHRIAGYGTALIERRSGGDLSLSLRTSQLAGIAGKGSLRAVPPAWRHDVTGSTPVSVEIRPGGEPVRADAGTTTLALKSLSSGLKAVIEYRGTKGDPVEVVLSTVGFQPAWRVFTRCSAALIDVPVEKVQNQVVYFDAGSVHARPGLHHMIGDVAKYAASATELKGIRLLDHTGSPKGSPAEKKFRSRAKHLHDALVRQGMDPARIHIAAGPVDDPEQADWLNLRLFGPEGASAVYFETGKARMEARSEQVLDMLVEYMRDNGIDASLQINGYTDSVGRKRHNRALGEKRAAVVRDYLRLRGIDDKRLRLRSWGESKPAASNRKETGRSLNRRVEIAFR